MNTTDYLSRARKKMAVPSDSAIAALIGVNKSMITYWRAGKVPEWDNMRELAKLAGVDERLALIDWAVLKTKGAAAKTADALRKTLPMLSVVAMMSAALVGGFPVNSAQSLQHTTAQAVYYV